ncbi:competence protein CoiA [Staphylococcus lutrae]|uniref:Competence protein CoiA n=1 Tax=Staphylococcus lutrae TaxID=155085 RepID=A0AAC9RUV4_9STAP|nr:competence protein CoiA family protein [Staphylococcus lutrae]ARJ51425.1 competence protein CoiA [Staphylococcus lutrae]PNZ39557.1 competence protein CoiA [Staphylococcus lutrae]
MLTAYNAQLEQIFASHANKKERYYCPVCKAPLILKTGIRKAPHFAHFHHGQAHVHHKGESIQHRQCKSMLYQKLQTIDSHVKLEPYLSEVAQIPDIIFKKWAIEIQFSPIGIRKLRERTRGLRDAGYQVIWLTSQPRQRNGQYCLSQLQQQCIIPSHRTLYCIDTIQFQLICLSGLIPLSHNTFHVQSAMIPISKFGAHLEAMPTQSCEIRKLSTSQILNYIQQCRRKNSVLDTTLSLMYQMRLTDIQVTKLTGYLFPEQLYIQTHPVLWQLVMLSALQTKQQIEPALYEKIKWRYFAIEGYDKRQIIHQVIQRYLKLLHL